MKWFRNVMMFVALGISIFCIYNFWTEFSKYRDADRGNKAVVEAVSADEFDGEIDFEKLWRINQDVVGWIYQNGTNINYPVVKSDNNRRYLNENLQVDYSVMGTLFIDANNKDNLEVFNTIIYGHHMKDPKQSMFGSIKNYFCKKGYYEKHKRFEYITPDEKYHLEIIAAYTTPAGGDAYQYEPEDRQAFVDNAVKKSQINARCSANPDDEVMRLQDILVLLRNTKPDGERKLTLSPGTRASLRQILEIGARTTKECQKELLLQRKSLRG